MKRPFGFVIPTLAVLMCVPLIAAQSSQAQSPVQTSTTPYTLGQPPPGNNWLLNYWYCIPSSCFDYVLAQNGVAHTEANGTPFGTPYSYAYNVHAVANITATNCSPPVFLEAGTATFRLTTKKYLNKTYGMEGLIVPAQVVQNSVILAFGYDLEWTDGTFMQVPFLVPC
jgi:hypothetical protein